MKTRISYRNISQPSHPGLEKIASELAERHLERYLSQFQPELVRLHAHFEKSNHRGFYRVKLRLDLPSGTLTTAEQSEDLAVGIRKSFAELERQLERHIAHLSREDAWRRKERRQALRRLKTAIGGRFGDEIELFGDLVRPLLPALQGFAERELAYLQARGDLSQDYPTADDVIDEALARAYQGLPQRPARLAPQEWLYRITLAVLAEEVARRQTEEGRFVSIESKLPVGLAQTVEDRDEARFEYWQPDEMLRLEDVLPAAESTPDEAVSAEEARRYLARALADLPTAWRRAVLLVQAEGLSSSAVAQVLGVNEADLGRWLEYADAFLKARLEEVGIHPTESGMPLDYIVSGLVTPATRLARDFDEVTRAAP